MSDLISREAAFDEIIWNSDNGVIDAKVAIEALRKLPSIEPERKAGHWIRGEAYPHHIYCSECYKTFIPNDEFRVWANGDIPRKYCPECGAPMEVKTDNS